MTKAVAQPGSKAPKTEWWSGREVREHFALCKEADAALISLGHSVAARKSSAAVASAVYPKDGGRPKVVDPAPVITPDLWWRIQALVPDVDIWAAPVLSLPRTGNEKAIDLVGLCFSAKDVRKIGEAHGYTPQTASKPKSNGGIVCRAHGVAVTKLVLKLLSQPEDIPNLTAVKLRDTLKGFYEKCDNRGLTDQNLDRVASGVLHELKEHINKVEQRPLRMQLNSSSRVRNIRNITEASTTQD
ncbi:hypothetical protein QP150_16305 [Sphingomonas sp. 22L2VL55-3]